MSQTHHTHVVSEPEPEVPALPVIGWLQLALAVRDARSAEALRGALLDLRDAAALALEELGEP